MRARAADRSAGNGGLDALGPLRCVVKLAGFVFILAVTPFFCLAAAAGRREPAMGVWCRLVCRALRLRVSYRGGPVPDGCLVVSNHVGYLDPVVLSAFLSLRFLAKSEIAHWPLVGVLARLSGAFFVERDRPRSSSVVVKAVGARLTAGDRILLFPEAGVSPDGFALAPFRPMLFEACVEAARPVVPVALCYWSPPEPDAWAWFDSSSLRRHLVTRLLPAPAICVELRVGEPLVPAEGENRKQLAARAQEGVARLLEPRAPTP